MSKEKETLITKCEVKQEFPKGEQMSKEKWTMKEWEKSCEVNCHNTYSMAVNFAALCIKEFGKDKGLKQVRGISGAQAGFAIALSEKIKNIKFPKQLVAEKRRVKK